MQKNPQYSVLVGPGFRDIHGCTRVGGTRVPVPIIWQDSDGAKISSFLIVSEWNPVDNPSRRFFVLKGYIMDIDGFNGFEMEWNTNTKEGHIQFINECHPAIDPSLIMEYGEHSTRICPACGATIDTRYRFCRTCCSAVRTAIKKSVEEYWKGAEIHPPKVRTKDHREDTRETKHGTNR